MDNKFTPEQIKKARACKTIEKLIELAKENGVEITEAEATNYFAQLNPENGELSDRELEAVAGGGCFGNIYCPSGDVHQWYDTDYEDEYFIEQKCLKCGETQFITKNEGFMKGWDGLV